MTPTPQLLCEVLDDIKACPDDEIANTGGGRKNDNERDDDQGRLPELVLARPRDTLGFRANTTQIFTGLLCNVHLSSSQKLAG